MLGGRESLNSFVGEIHWATSRSRGDKKKIVNVECAICATGKEDEDDVKGK